MMAATCVASMSFLKMLSIEAMASSSLTPCSAFGKARMEHAAREGPEAQLVGCDLAGHAQRHQRAAVVAAGEADHARPAGVGAGDLDRVFQRLGAAGQQQRLLGKVARRQRVQLLGQFDIGLVGQHLEAGVGVQLQLCLDCLDHLRVAVAGVEHGDAAGKVDVALALDVPDLGVVGAGGEDGVGVADTAGHRGVAPGHQLGVGLVAQVGLGITLHGIAPWAVRQASCHRPMTALERAPRPQRIMLARA